MSDRRRLALAMIAFAVACASEPDANAELAEYRQVHMGMEVRIAIRAARPQADTLADRAFARIAELEAIVSDWNPQSELRRLERTPAGEWSDVSAPLCAVLALSLTMARETDGAFDPTVGALTALWRESVRTGAPIPDSARSRALRSVGWEGVELDCVASRVRLQRSGTRLDLGAIAKGWILDEALQTIPVAAAPAVLIEAGGDIVVRGAPVAAPSGNQTAATPGEGWRIAVRTPSGDSTLVVRDAAISTSSARAQLSAPSGAAAEGHVFRRSDGRGATDTPQVTVVGTRAAITDALATALPLLPRARWPVLAARYGVQVIEGPPPDTR